MLNTTIPDAGGATAPGIRSSPIGQSPPSNSIPWHGDRTIAYLQDSTLLSEISQLLLILLPFNGHNEEEQSV